MEIAESWQSSEAIQHSRPLESEVFSSRSLTALHFSSSELMSPLKTCISVFPSTQQPSTFSQLCHLMQTQQQWRMVLQNPRETAFSFFPSFPPFCRSSCLWNLSKQLACCLFFFNFLLFFVFLGKVARREAFIFIRAIRFCRFIRLFFVVVIVVAICVQLPATRKIASNIISLLKKISVFFPGALGICAVLKLQQNQESDIRLLPLFFLMCLTTDIVPQGLIFP